MSGMTSAQDENIDQLIKACEELMELNERLTKENSLLTDVIIEHHLERYVEKKRKKAEEKKNEMYFDVGSLFEELENESIKRQVNYLELSLDERIRMVRMGDRKEQ